MHRVFYINVFLRLCLAQKWNRETWPGMALSLQSDRMSWKGNKGFFLTLNTLYYCSKKVMKLTLAKAT